MMRRLILTLVLTFSMLGLATSLYAEGPRQEARLELFDPNPTSDTLDGTTPERTYNFDCFADTVLSVRVDVLSGDIEPELVVFDTAGRELAQGQVVQPTPPVVVAEGFMPNFDGVCSAQVSLGTGTSGTVMVQLLAGYARLEVRDSFAGGDDPLALTWEPWEGEGAGADLIDEQLHISITKPNWLGWADPEEDLVWSDFYLQADVTILDDPSYYEYGFNFFIDETGDHFYSLSFSTDSDWVLSYYDNGEWVTLQEWTVSPVIDGADKTPHIAMFTQGTSLYVFFGNERVSMIDIGDYASEGSFALVAATGAEQTEPVTAAFDNVIITTPLANQTAGLPFGGMGQPEQTVTPEATQSGLAELFGNLSATPPPTQSPLIRTTPVPTQDLMMFSQWESTRPADVVAELQRLGLAPEGGSEALNVPTSFGETSTGGFSYYPLGQGRTFRNFVLAFDARLLETGPESGCGMHFRGQTQSTVSGIVFQDGYVLLAEFDANGDVHPDTIYDTFPAVLAGEGSRNRVHIIANEADVTMFVNGQMVGTVQFTPSAGSLALELFVASDDAGNTVRTYCQVDNIWLWEF